MAGLRRPSDLTRLRRLTTWRIVGRGRLLALSGGQVGRRWFRVSRDWRVAPPRGPWWLLRRRRSGPSTPQIGAREPGSSPATRLAPARPDGGLLRPWSVRVLPETSNVDVGRHVPADRQGPGLPLPSTVPGGIRRPWVAWLPVSEERLSPRGSSGLSGDTRGSSRLTGGFQHGTGSLSAFRSASDGFPRHREQAGGDSDWDPRPALSGLSGYRKEPTGRSDGFHPSVLWPRRSLRSGAPGDAAGGRTPVDDLPSRLLSDGHPRTGGGRFGRRSAETGDRRTYDVLGDGGSRIGGMPVALDLLRNSSGLHPVLRRRIAIATRYRGRPGLDSFAPESGPRPGRQSASIAGVTSSAWNLRQEQESGTPAHPRWRATAPRIEASFEEANVEAGSTPGLHRSINRFIINAPAAMHLFAAGGIGDVRARRSASAVARHRELAPEGFAWVPGTRSTWLVTPRAGLNPMPWNPLHEREIGAVASSRRMSVGGRVDGAYGPGTIDGARLVDRGKIWRPYSARFAMHAHTIADRGIGRGADIASTSAAAGVVSHPGAGTAVLGVSARGIPSRRRADTGSADSLRRASGGEVSVGPRPEAEGGLPWFAGWMSAVRADDSSRSANRTHYRPAGGWLSDLGPVARRHSTAELLVVTRASRLQPGRQWSESSGRPRRAGHPRHDRMSSGEAARSASGWSEPAHAFATSPVATVPVFRPRFDTATAAVGGPARTVVLVPEGASASPTHVALSRRDDLGRHERTAGQMSSLDNTVVLPEPLPDARPPEPERVHADASPPRSQRREPDLRRLMDELERRLVDQLARRGIDTWSRA
jgi:hypothetical protein